MLAFTVYYTVPVYDRENPRVKTVTVSTSEDKELKYSEYGPIYFGIFSAGMHQDYDRSMINVYINYTEFEGDEAHYDGNNTIELNNTL